MIVPGQKCTNELHKLIIIVVEYLIVNKLGSNNNAIWRKPGFE